MKFLNDKSNTLSQQVAEDSKSIQRAKFSLDSLLSEKESLEKILHETTYLVEKLQKEYKLYRSAANMFDFCFLIDLFDNCEYYSHTKAYKQMSQTQ